MTTLLQQRLNLLADDAHRALLAQGRRGIERETLRVDAHGALAQTPHPVVLGAALTHQTITTDYAEALLEFITPAEHDIADALQQLDASHRFFYQQTKNELLWSQSMPCVLPAESEIPIAWYGTSHIGMLKHVYRRGLALRYGKTMQCIAGIHYNFSVAEKIWAVLQAAEKSSSNAQDYQSESYIATIRNFHRYSWLLMVLFGASPALSTNFMRGRAHQLQSLSDDTLYLPFATSLRMSDLGYQNNAQAGLVPPYNDLASYMQSLTRAVRQPWPAYVELGAKRADEWVQINTNVLQIENEFYSTIRPKRVINSGERPIEALCARGVQYIEVRCMDIDPFEPLGITLEASRFLDAFLLFCALDQSALTSNAEGLENTHNFAQAVKEGRRPGLQLQRNGEAVDLKQWGLQLLDRIDAAAHLLDVDRAQPDHQNALASQRAKLHDFALTPSAKVLAALPQYGNSFVDFSLAQSRKHADWFASRPLSEVEQNEFARMARASIEEQTRMENNQSGDFDTFIEAYRLRALTPSCCD